MKFRLLPYIICPNHSLYVLVNSVPRHKLRNIRCVYWNGTLALTLVFHFACHEYQCWRKFISYESPRLECAVVLFWTTFDNRLDLHPSIILILYIYIYDACTAFVQWLNLMCIWILLSLSSLIQTKSEICWCCMMTPFSLRIYFVV